MKTIYIAGKITGEPNYKRYFDAAKRLLQQQGYAVLSPADLPQEGFNYCQYMHICKAMLMECDTICLLPNWTESNGASIERRLAYTLGKRVANLSWADIGEAGYATMG